MELLNLNLIDAGMIFDSIPPLPDPEIERKRLEVFNYCISIDIRYDSFFVGLKLTVKIVYSRKSWLRCTLKEENASLRIEELVSIISIYLPASF